MATITNSICTNDKLLNIFTYSNNIYIGSISDATAITIGNSTGSTGITFNTTSGSFTPGNINLGSGISTTPPTSNTVNTAFGTTISSGTPIQNTLGYNILVNIFINATTNSMSTGVANVGVYASSQAAQNSYVMPAGTFPTYQTTQTFNLTVIVPNNYYLYLDLSNFNSSTVYGLWSCAI